MGLFDWIGKGKREEEWMAQPRRLPSGTDEYDSDRWIMSHEFANEKNKNIRIYMAAHKRKNSDTWTVSLYKTDLKRDLAMDVSPEYDVDVTSDPMAVVRTLSEFDRRYRNSEEWLPIEGHRGTYRPFANKYGIHFDDDGNIIKIKEDTRIATGVFMNRESLDDLFHKAANKPDVSTWDGLYNALVRSWPESWTVSEEKLVPAKILEAAPETPAAEPPVAEIKAPAEGAESVAELPKAEKPADAATETPAETPAAGETPAPPPEPKFETVIVTRPLTLQDLANDPQYPKYAKDMRELMQQIDKLPETLANKSLTRRQKEKVINDLVGSDLATGFANADTARLANRLRRATVVVGLLRTGVAMYEDFAKGKFSPESMTMMSYIGNVAASITGGTLELDDASAKKVADIIAKGRDPNGADLPLAAIFKQYPPEDAAARKNPSGPKNG